MKIIEWIKAKLFNYYLPKIKKIPSFEKEKDTNFKDLKLKFKSGKIDFINEVQNGRSE